MGSQTTTVVPAQAGTQVVAHAQRILAALRTVSQALDSSLRWNDGVDFSALPKSTILF